MCRVIEEMRKEERAEAIKENTKVIALRMLKAGKYALEEIAAISGLSLDEVKRLRTTQQ